MRLRSLAPSFRFLLLLVCLFGGSIALTGCGEDKAVVEKPGGAAVDPGYEARQKEMEDAMKNQK